MILRFLFKQRVLRMMVIVGIILCGLLGVNGIIRIMAQADTNISEAASGSPTVPSELPPSDDSLIAGESPLTESSSISSSEQITQEINLSAEDFSSMVPSAPVLPTSWYSVVGAVFLPANSGYSYQYGNSGCLKSNSAGYWRASVNLPNKSVVKYLLMSYYNGMYSKNSSVYLTRYKYNGDYQDIQVVNSRNYTTTATTGYYWDISPEITATIDNLNNGYTFIWSGSTTQRLCSVKVGFYPPPIFGSAMPAVIK